MVFCKIVCSVCVRRPTHLAEGEDRERGSVNGGLRGERYVSRTRGCPLVKSNNEKLCFPFHYLHSTNVNDI